MQGNIILDWPDLVLRLGPHENSCFRREFATFELHIENQQYATSPRFKELTHEILLGFAAISLKRRFVISLADFEFSIVAQPLKTNEVDLWRLTLVDVSRDRAEQVVFEWQLILVLSRVIVTIDTLLKSEGVNMDSMDSLN